MTDALVGVRPPSREPVESPSAEQLLRTKSWSAKPALRAGRTALR